MFSRAWTLDPMCFFFFQCRKKHQINWTRFRQSSSKYPTLEKKSLGSWVQAPKNINKKKYSQFIRTFCFNQNEIYLNQEARLFDSRKNRIGSRVFILVNVIKDLDYRSKRLFFPVNVQREDCCTKENVTVHCPFLTLKCVHFKVQNATTQANGT